MNKSYKKMKTKSYKFKKIVISAGLLAGIFVANSGIASASDITPENVGYLINSERIYYGLEPLKINLNLDSAATLKTNDMLKRNYFEHFAFGLTPWDFMRNANYNYLYAGENLAMDFQSSEGMVNAWMKSDLHRKNILNEDYDEMGIGIVKGAYTQNGQSHDTIIVDNMFGRQKPVILEAFDKIIARISQVFKF